MWSKDKSAFLSSVLIKIVYGLIAACCVFAPFLAKYYDDNIIAAQNMPSVFLPLLITLYAAVPPAVLALFRLDRMLGNIRKGQPFISDNVKSLRIISYCCFAESLVFVYFSFLKPFALVIILAAAFIGLILRVVKNVFEQAVALREENDFTI